MNGSCYCSAVHSIQGAFMCSYGFLVVARFNLLNKLSYERDFSSTSFPIPVALYFGLLWQIFYDTKISFPSFVYLIWYYRVLWHFSSLYLSSLQVTISFQSSHVPIQMQVSLSHTTFYFCLINFVTESQHCSIQLQLAAEHYVT